MAKWALVIAGLKDLQRPADKLSLNQNLALAATGFIWVRANATELRSRGCQNGFELAALCRMNASRSQRRS